MPDCGPLAGGRGHGGTLGALWTEAREVCRGAGLESADLDARLLVAACAGVSMTALATEPAAAVAEDAGERLRAALARRLAGESVGRILGRRAFWTLDLALGDSTLEPRPETETLVSAVLDVVGRRAGADAPLAVLDLGTGSGAILLALLSELPRARGVGVDIQPEAAAIAASNALRHLLSDRAQFVVGDFCRALRGPFDVIVSNPPYIRSGDIDRLAPEVRADPRLALDGGDDGLDCYRAIVASAPGVLSPGGWMFLEIAPAHLPGVTALAETGGWTLAETFCDLAGAVRVVAMHLRTGGDFG